MRVSGVDCYRFGLELGDRNIPRQMNEEDVEYELAYAHRQQHTSIGAPRAGWKKIAGAAKNDHDFPEAMKLGDKWRTQANQENWQDNVPTENSSSGV